jgi:hypothetical protein
VKKAVKKSLHKSIVTKQKKPIPKSVLTQTPKGLKSNPKKKKGKKKGKKYADINLRTTRFKYGGKGDGNADDGTRHGLNPVELAAGRKISSNIYARQASASRGHLYCKDRWRITRGPTALMRCSKCTPGYFLVPDYRIHNKLLGTCFSIRDVKQGVKTTVHGVPCFTSAIEQVHKGKVGVPCLYKTYDSEYGLELHMLDRKSGMVMKRNMPHRRRRSRRMLGAISVTAEPSTFFQVYTRPSKVFVIGIRVFLAKFSACHNTKVHGISYACDKSAVQGRCEALAICIPNCKGCPRPGHYGGAKCVKHLALDLKAPYPVAKEDGSAAEKKVFAWVQKAKKILMTTTARGGQCSTNYQKTFMSSEG